MEEELGFDGSFEEFADHFVDGLTLFGDYFEHLKVCVLDL